MSLEEAADNTKVGLQDDMYAVAELEELTSLQEELKIELQACGHRLRMRKCKVWFPGWDDTGDDDLPQEARVLLQKIPRQAAWSYWEWHRKGTGVQRSDRHRGQEKTG